MFTLEQVTDIHDRLGNKGTLGGYSRALRDIGVEAYDSYLRYMQQVEEGGVGYAEMSKALADDCR